MEQRTHPRRIIDGILYWTQLVLLFYCCRRSLFPARSKVFHWPKYGNEPWFGRRYGGIDRMIRMRFGIWLARH